MSYCWIITDDYQDGAAKGVIGPRGAKLTKEEIENHKEKMQFRMFDADNIEYYQGWLVIEDGFRDDRMFAPLDDFGKGNAGCVRLDFYLDGRWNTI